MQEENLEKIEAEAKKIRYNLNENKELTLNQRLLLLNVLRYDVSLLEERDKVEQVWYNAREKKLEYSESVQMGIAISLHINEAIRNESDVGAQQELYKAMQETYYFLARHLFEYFLPALEFGIAPEKQFIAPRTSVLNPLAKEYSKFYYRKDRPVMVVSMPQRNGKNADIKRIFGMGDRERA